uniref:Alpha-carbonic anhydrase domain-containing protein n=1 Tax=Daucus carota subsp. sativus TaxID=79200 RepID=A0A165ZYH8_DAUCS
MTSGFLILSLLLIILHVMTVVTAQDGLRGPTCRTCGGTKSEFDYSKTSGKGPAFWGTLKTEWATCGTGKLQSPVDLTVNGVVDVVPQLETVTRRYKPCTNTMLTNKGTSIEPQNFAVISILYKIGHSPDPFLAKLERNISAFIADESVKEIERGVLDPTDIGISGREFYRYQGSLTTPPCTERVVWTVEEQIKTVSADQVELLQEAVDDNSEMNARPLQQLNGRDVRLYVDHST